MPGKLRRLSGPEVVNILCGFGFVIHTQRGSHVKLRRITAAGQRQTLVVPNHREIDRGTLHAIYRQATRFISAQDVHPHFHTE